MLTSAPYAFPLTLHWTPADDPLNVSQSVYRASGRLHEPACRSGGPITTFQGNSTTDFTGRPVDGTYCYHIRVADLLTTADGPGVTVSVDTTNPSATVGVSGQSPAGVVSGSVGVSGTSADAVSGVASSVLHAGAPGACASGPVLTVGVGHDRDGQRHLRGLQRGHRQRGAQRDRKAHADHRQPRAAGPAAPLGSTGTAGAAALDRVAPKAPTKLKAVLPRRRHRTGIVPVRLRWVNPAAADLDRVVAVLNKVRSPRAPADGRVIYRGRGASAVLALRVGQRAHVALFAFDHSGNVSPAARVPVTLAALVPLRPLTGSVLRAAPRLRWKPHRGTAYYNLQLFHNGKRVLVAWPSRTFYRPVRTLEAGTYVWYVWPAVRHKGAAPTFGALIGRATFVVRP